jgi:hypothetical protein
MLRKKVGRRKGRRTKGFFFRNGRGWFTKVQGKFVPLLGPNGHADPRTTLTYIRNRDRLSNSPAYVLRY